MELGRISPRQLAVLTMLYTIGSALLIVPSGMALTARQDAWIAAIVGMAAGAAILWLYGRVAALHQGKSLPDILEAVLGRWLGNAVMAVYGVTLIFAGPAPVVYFVTVFMTTQIMPETPNLPFAILFGLIVAYGMRLGLETLSRTAELLLPWFITFFLLFIALSLPNIHPVNALPMLERGIGPIWPSAMHFLSIVYFPTFILLTIFPTAVRDSAAMRRALVQGGMAGGFTVAVVVALTVLVLGPELTARNLYPVYALAKKIDIANVVQRIEATVALLWFITLYYRITLYTYAIMAGIARVLRLKEYRSLALPFSFLLVVLSMIVYPSIPYYLKWSTSTLVAYGILFGLLLPLLLLAVHGIRRLFASDESESVSGT